MLQSNLKSLLNVKGYTIRSFSRAIEYRFDTVRLLAHNELTRIPADLIEKACRELHVTPGELFTIMETKDGNENNDPTTG